MTLSLITYNLYFKIALNLDVLLNNISNVEWNILGRKFKIYLRKLRLIVKYG